MVKVDKFRDEEIKHMYSLYSTMTFLEFKEWARGAIDTNLVSSNAKKESLKRSLIKARNKDEIVMFMTNVAFAGSGMGVI